MTIDYGLRKLHSHLLLIMDDIDRVCRKHNILYSLWAGSLLGAVRHKGFIPWDDDVDLCFSREQYEKFMRIYPKEMHESFVIGNVFNKTTMCVIKPDAGLLGKQNTYELPGPWVSIFVYDQAPINVLRSQFKVFEVKLLMGMMGKPPHYRDFCNRTKMLFTLASWLGAPFSERTKRRWHVRASSRHNKKHHRQVAVYNTFDYDLAYTYPSKWFREYINCDFENRSFMCLKEYDAVLTRLYGDYLTPPPKNQRIPKHIEPTELEN